MEQADDEDGQPDREILAARVRRRRRGELRHHLLVVIERPGEEVREEGDEDDVAQEIIGRCVAACHVDQERYLREREERDADRQHDRAARRRHASEAGERADEEVEIFEIEEDEEIAGDADDEKSPSLHAGAPCDRPTDAEVEQDREAEQPEIGRVPPAVKEQ